MDISKFDYFLPRELIAQNPANPRDYSKLAIIERKSGNIYHIRFRDITNFLTKNDVLVFNKSKVFPARIFGRKKVKGKVEVLILRFLPDFTCEVITKPGLFLYDTVFFEGFEGKIIKRDGYITHIKFNIDENTLLHKINIIGHTPIPPYIKTSLSEKDLREKYQTVYAKITGSAAAPTAGLHFTKELIKKIKKAGIAQEFVTLHVGLGTFTPIKVTDIEKHKIHEEYFSVDQNTINRLNKAKNDGKRIIAVGTTTTRVLETLVDNNSQLIANAKRQFTDLFIYPPYKFRFVDGLITNFHLPKSTLLTMVSSFVSYPNNVEKFSDFKSGLLGKVYEEAVLKEYRFFSFGDAMFIS
jgi:S-adenosylmethionine:tRNA ribosyltransferase-isomerase